MNAEARRDSFCCAEEGCRRRLTPGSVRFLGRKVDAGFIVVLLAALRHGLSAQRVSALQEALGVDRRTLERWRSWWLEQFAPGRDWRAARAQFMPPLDEAALPWSLWNRFTAHHDDPLGESTPLPANCPFISRPVFSGQPRMDANGRNSQSGLERVADLNFRSPFGEAFPCPPRDPVPIRVNWRLFAVGLNCHAEGT
ncbi:MAG: hypothetical protein Q7S40_32035 [Opitutaceae bacterium]|nr:hypothetical protein [Opitutaceae bacterium]